MADINFEFKLVDNELKPRYYDKHTRDDGIAFFKQVKNEDYVPTDPDKKEIDLIDKLLGYERGAEGESDGWDGDYWKHYKSNIFNHICKTLNIPHRKFKYWNLQNLSRKIRRQIGRDHIDLGFENNWYYRINVQRDQIIIVHASIIRDPRRRFVTIDGRTEMSNVLEDWICVPREYCETYNLQPNGKWVRDGVYHGPRPEDCPEIERKRKEKIKKLVSELLSKRLQELRNNKENKNELQESVH